ncbi:MAG TPA: hypothetical protein DCL74_00790 [Succinivibrionaceae bacterium]|nr:hypothetical protein [Succinivibrionaceae bacterium]
MPYNHKNKEGGRESTARLFSAAFAKEGGQNGALKFLADNAVPVCIFLITGVKFEGVINSFDQYTVGIVDIKGNQQLIYKDKISTLTLRRVGVFTPRMHQEQTVSSQD